MSPFIWIVPYCCAFLAIDRAGTSAALTASTLLVVDGADLWKYISQQGAVHDAAWVTPEYPDGNFTIGPACRPCLFNLRLDPEERHDLAPAQPEATWAPAEQPTRPIAISHPALWSARRDLGPQQVIWGMQDRFPALGGKHELVFPLEGGADAVCFATRITHPVLTR